MSARDQMSLPTQFAVSDALTTQGVMGTERQGREAVLALHELGFGAAAAALDECLALRRELFASVGATYTATG